MTDKTLFTIDYTVEEKCRICGVVNNYDRQTVRIKELCINCFKDLPNILNKARNAEIKPETQSHISELSPEVKEAKIDMSSEVCLSDNAEEIVDNEIEESAEESIWKPVSELPERKKNGEVLLKHKNGTIRLACLFIENSGKENAFCPIHLRGSFSKEYFTHYATVGDLFNDYEKLKERVKKLEGK